MDLSAEVAKRFNISSNGNGSAKTADTAAPVKKMITIEEINSVLGMGVLDDVLHEAEEKIREEGYHEDSILLVYQTLEKIFSDKVKSWKGEAVEPQVKAPATNGSAKTEAPEEKPEVKQEQAPAQAAQKNLLDYVYDFETFPPLTCMFVGPGPAVLAEGRPLKTWKVQDMEKTEWLIPQWSIFGETQGSFQGFQNEEPGKYIYQMNYKGVQQLPDNRIKFMVQILKKFPG